MAGARCHVRPIGSVVMCADRFADMVANGPAAEDVYAFDLRGYVVVHGVLNGRELAYLNGDIDRRGGLRTGAWLGEGEHFLDWGPAFRALLTHLGVVRYL